MHQSRLETVTLPPPAGLVLFGQAAYFLITAIWPLVSARIFQKVTGPKVDFWLVKAVGLLIGVVGLDLLFAAGRSRATAETVRVGAGALAAHLAGLFAGCIRRSGDTEWMALDWTVCLK